MSSSTTSAANVDHRGTPRPRSLRRRLRQQVGEAYLKLTGWDVDAGRPDVDKAVVIAYPHTSNWDITFTLAAAYVLDVDIQWLGKKSLFDPPFGFMLRWLGGVPVDRSKRTKMVDAMAETMRDMARGLIIIPPEGTRSAAGRWKSGFYWVAVGAEVPIVLGYVDFGRKRAGLGEMFRPTGDLHADFAQIRAFYEGMQGKFPDKQGPIRLREEEEAAAKASNGAHLN